MNLHCIRYQNRAIVIGKIIIFITPERLLAEVTIKKLIFSFSNRVFATRMQIVHQRVFHKKFFKFKSTKPYRTIISNKNYFRITKVSPSYGRITLFIVRTPFINHLKKMIASSEIIT